MSSNGVVVTLPKGIAQKEAERFLFDHAQWVAEQLERISKQKKPSYLPDDVILWHGVPTQMQRVEEPGRKTRMKVEEFKGRLRIYLPAGTKVSTRQAIEVWMRQESKQEIEKKVFLQAERMHAKPKSISIRDQRTRWGSCSSRGTLSFNWRLVMTPPEIMEYVVIHELAHLFQPNHSKEFWAVVAKFSPDYKNARLWLRKNATALRIS